MAPQELKGILVALVTPFTDDGKAVHEGRLQAHIERMIDTGVHGLVPGGTTGEFTAMTLEERKQATELCVRYAAGRVPVVAGVGALSTRECVDLATHAAKAGAAALMLVPPCTYQQDQRSDDASANGAVKSMTQSTTSNYAR